MQTVTPFTPKALWLFHHGQVALAKVEADGIRIDTDYIKRIRQESLSEINRLTAECRNMREWKLWEKQFGGESNIMSDDQCRWLCERIGIVIEQRTKGDKLSMSASSLADCDNQFIQHRGQIKEMEKAVGTFLKGVQSNTDVNGYLHCGFNLNTVNTFRSSSSSPNFQNFPKRKPAMAKIVRSAFIPREGHQLLEVDYAGVEVKIAFCYHKDPTMRKYLCGEHGDMHMDVGREVFMLSEKEMTKQIRSIAKNAATFPEFYGSYWRDVSRGLWNAIRDNDLKTADGMCLYEHLANNGIEKLGDGYRDPEPDSFQSHILQWETKFWQQRFNKYYKWRLNCIDEYYKTGYVPYLTGFRVHGMLRRNQIFNFPIQGAAFHILLYSMICLMRELKRRKMRSLVVGQIHDSLVCDVHCDELQEFKELLKECMLVKVKEFYPWAEDTPLDIDISVGQPGASWWNCGD